MSDTSGSSDGGRTAGKRPARGKAKAKPKETAKKLRISLVLEPEAEEIIEGLMRISGAPTKADLFRKALEHYEQFLMEREERRTRLGLRRSD